MISVPIQSIFRGPWRTFLFVLISSMGITTGYAHRVASASLVLYLNTEEERTFTVSTQMEVESSGDAARDDEIGPEEAARIFVENQLIVLIDEKEQSKNLTTELILETDDETPKALERFSVLVTWPGKLPDSGKDLALYLNETSEMSIVIHTIKNGIPARRVQVMFAGEYSRAENIEPLVKGNPFDKVAPNPKTESAPPTEVDKADDHSSVQNLIKAGAFASLHKMILPLCLLLALILLKGSFRALILPFATFLVAHSFGFALSSMGLIPVYPWAVWVCIGALLALAIDNLFSFKFRWWRYIAGAAGGFFLGNEMTQSGPILALGGTPLNLESFVPFQIGLIIVILLAALLLGILMALFGRFSHFRSIVVIPMSILLAGVALVLTLQGKTEIVSLIKLWNGSAG